MARGKRPPVRITINGYSYRITVAVMGGKFMVGVSAEHRAGADVQGGDQVEVGIELDTAPREVSVPADLAKALAADAKAKLAFDKLSFSNRQRHVLSVEGTKNPVTRARRIATAVETLRESGRERSPHRDLTSQHSVPNGRSAPSVAKCAAVSLP